MIDLQVAERTAVEQVAAYVVNLRFEDLPELAITRGRQVVLDFIGTTLGGYQTELGKRTAEFAARRRAGNEATIIGDGRRSTLDGAAWANGTTSCILGMTETHRICGHVATEVVPVALAIGEHRQLDGRAVIQAIAAGYDVFGVIRPAVVKAHREKGLDTKGHVGTLGGAATAGVALGLDEAGVANALALAMDMACGTEQYAFDAGLCDTEGLLAGYAASNGIMAASMADFGFQGPPGALDGPYGYFHAYGEGYDPSYLDTLGETSMLASAGFKPHSGCRCVHACADAALDLIGKQRPPLDQIVSIDVGTYLGAVTPEFRVNYHPETADAAGYSLPVTVATILTRGSFYREDIEAYKDPEIQRLMRLVRVHLDEEIEAGYPETMGCVVQVRTGDGTVYEGRVDLPKGEPENMLTDEEFERKFRRLVGDLLPEERVARLIEMAWRLEEIEDIGELVRLAARL
jgi:2-methylcitrate dehydratase PrpD